MGHLLREVARRHHTAWPGLVLTTGGGWERRGDDPPEADEGDQEHGEPLRGVSEPLVAEPVQAEIRTSPMMMK